MKKLFAALFMLLALAACGEQQLKFENTDLTGLGYGKGFSLNDHTGKPVTLESYKGKVVVLFFGFTHCPDVCPTTMAEMSAVMKELGPDADKVQVLFATLDPERDSKELLSQYVPGFDARFVGLYGTPEQVAATAKEFKVFYQKVPGKTADSYTIDHTAGSYVFDKSGKLRLFLRHGGGPAPVVHDLKLLVAN
ncbi:protein SCO1/2 [Duganella sp. CF458]|uniref:SCO family protein n=1 Tax=Duganella sp. CF458 TaxID=1884368 RepID=UPI0008E14893|nr:SCO family protein [Duganella sp. CF458]SFG04126.1 protein SCO1/2 [Duganella sp. CF458]